MKETLESVHQRLALRLGNIEGVFGVFLGDGTALLVLLRQRLAYLHDEAKRQVVEIVNTEAPGTPVKFEVTEQEYPTGGLAPE